MNKKLFVISGILLMILFTSTIPAIPETNDAGVFGRTHLRAIGRNFHICDDDGGLYGHIFIGFRDFKFVFNEDIYIPEESIKLIIMTNHFVNIIYKE